MKNVHRKLLFHKFLSNLLITKATDSKYSLKKKKK
jgi:hypothetical protein